MKTPLVTWNRQFFLVSIAPLLTALSFVGVAQADASSAQLAQALFDEARRLMADRRYGEACPKLAESQRLDPGGGTLLNLAMCHAAEGKLATSLLEYQEALAMAIRDGRRDRERIARSSIDAVERDVPRLTVVVQPVDKGMVVQRDGTDLSSSAWGVALPVDPGSHTVSATQPGRQGWTTTFTMAVAEKKSVIVPTLALSPLITGARVVPTSAEAGQEVAARPRTKLNPVFYTAIGVAATAGAATLLTGWIALARQGEAEVGCLPEQNYCRDQASRDAASQVGTMAWVSTLALGISLVALTVAILVPHRRPVEVSELGSRRAHFYDGLLPRLNGGL